MLLTILLLATVVVLAFSFIVSSYTESYWKKRGVPYHGGRNMLGVFWDFFIGDRAFFVLLDDIYKEFHKAPAVGTAAMFVPTLLVRDPQNIQHVLSENFKAFYHRGLDVSSSDLLANNVLFLNGPVWKLIRQKMTPLFTKAKMKNMHYILDLSARDFVDYLKQNYLRSSSNAFDTLQLFCCASIGGAVFGVKTGTSTFESPFLDLAKSAVKPTFSFNCKSTIGALSPTLFKALGLKIFGAYETRFISAIKQILRERERDGVKCHDFADLALSIQKNGKMVDVTTGLELEPTDELLAAQAFFFLIAGVDPSATGMFATLFELSRHPDILKRVHDEVDRVFEEHEGVITSEVISKLTYLEQVIEEALRMHPPIGQIGRRCTEDTVLPVGNIKVDKGTQVIVPIFSIHYDPEYYPNPKVFDPERFTPEAMSERRRMTYLPFGEGNRLCIGEKTLFFLILASKSKTIVLVDIVSVKRAVSHDMNRFIT